VRPDFSITATGARTQRAVDKSGKPQGHVLRGDTVDVLRQVSHDLLVVGLGDPGKMHGHDLPDDGGPITLKALQAILEQALHERRHDYGPEEERVRNDETENRSRPSSSSG
jgi:stage V sporulation protein AE